MKVMNHEAGKGDVRMMKVRMMIAGQGDMATLNIDGRQHGAMMAGEHGASIADSAGQSWASTFSRSRGAGTAISLNANWLLRDAQAVILLNAKSPEIVEAQLPLADHLRDHQEVAGAPASDMNVLTYLVLNLPLSHESDKTLADLSMSRLQSDIDPGRSGRDDPTPLPPSRCEGGPCRPSPTSPRSPQPPSAHQLTLEVINA